MAKKDGGLVGLTKACNEILRVSKEYSYLWDDNKLMPGGYLPIFRGTHRYSSSFDDTAYEIYLGKSADDKIFFNGIFSNFSGSPDSFNSSRAEDAAKEMLRLTKESKEQITPENIRNGFYSALKGPLGKYLANKQLEKTV
jgi:hypothetical protein